MTKQLIVRETLYYLAYQDGPAESSKYYNTKKEAKKMLKSWPQTEQKSVCIMSKVIEREPNW